jgi:hypothetical protein
LSPVSKKKFLNSENLFSSRFPAIFLDYFSRRRFAIAFPVILTLLLDGSLARFLEQTHDSVSLDRSFSDTVTYTNQSVDAPSSLYIALIMVGSIIVSFIISAVSASFSSVLVFLHRL